MVNGFWWNVYSIGARAATSRPCNIFKVNRNFLNPGGFTWEERWLPLLATLGHGSTLISFNSLGVEFGALLECPFSIAKLAK